MLFSVCEFGIFPCSFMYFSRFGKIRLIDDNDAVGVANNKRHITKIINAI